MKRARLSIFLIIALTAAASGDVVFLKNGKKVEAKTAKKDGEVILTFKGGKTLNIPKDQVLFISQSDLTADAPTAPPKDLFDKKTPPPASNPASNPTETTESDTTTTPEPNISLPIEIETATLRIRDLEMPESFCFNLMRQTPQAAWKGSRQIKYYRGLIRDKQRRARGKWLTPANFIRLRNEFNKRVNEADELYKKSKTGRRTTGTTTMTTREHKELEGFKTQAEAKLREAAALWPDELLRQFLLAEAAMATENYSAAANYFGRCIKAQPEIPAFYQGLGLCQLQQKQYRSALETYKKLIGISVGNKNTAQLASNLLRQCPGNMLKHPDYLALQERLAELGYSLDMSRSSSSSANTRQSWIFPGKNVSSSTQSLSKLPFDRLIFKQTLGVPVGENTLLVDGSLLDDALDIGVQLDENTIVYGKLKKLSRSRGRSDKEPMPLAILTVDGAAFTPVAVPEKANIDPEKVLIGHTINVLGEMGNNIRKAPIKIQTLTPDGMATLSSGLAPGESTGPLFNSEGELVAMIAGKTDATSNELPDKLYTSDRIAPGIKKRSSRRSSRRQTIKPISVKGNLFRVFAIYDDNFSGKK